MNNLFSLSTPSDFNFKEIIRFLLRSDLECLFVIENGEIWQALEYEGIIFLIKIFWKKNTLQIQVINQVPTADQINFLRNYVKEWLDVSRNLTPFYQLASKDFILKTPVEQFRGLRMIGVPSLIEAISWAIIGQQINLKFAYTLKKRLIENYGSTFLFEGKKFYLFPKPEAIVKINPADLHALQFSRSKVKYLIGVAQAMVDGKISKEKLQEESYTRAKSQLIELKGVGNWTADYVLMKCLRHMDAFPIADVGLHNALKLQLGRSSKPSLEEIEEWSENWVGWKSYATFYLWHSLL